MQKLSYFSCLHSQSMENTNWIWWVMPPVSQAMVGVTVIVHIHHCYGWKCAFSWGWIVHIKTKSHLYDRKCCVGLWT